jgi:hypothetical protein
VGSHHHHAMRLGCKCNLSLCYKILPHDGISALLAIRTNTFRVPLDFEGTALGSLDPSSDHEKSDTQKAIFGGEQSIQSAENGRRCLEVCCAPLVPRSSSPLLKQLFFPKGRKQAIVTAHTTNERQVRQLGLTSPPRTNFPASKANPPPLNPSTIP